MVVVLVENIEHCRSVPNFLAHDQAVFGDARDAECACSNKTALFQSLVAGGDAEQVQNSGTVIQEVEIVAVGHRT